MLRKAKTGRAAGQNQGLPSHEPSGQIDLKPKSVLSSDTMYIMHGILLYVWQLHHLTYFKMLKIVCIKLFSMKIYWLISYLFSVNIG